MNNSIKACLIRTVLTLPFLFLFRLEKKRLIDSRTVPINHRGWIEFNVVSAVNHWQRQPTRNFGFQVELEDAFGNRLNPVRYIAKMNCSGENQNFSSLHVLVEKLTR